MRIFVTGATGFIGRRVCAALKGHDLRVLVRNGLKSLPLFPEDEIIQGTLPDDHKWIKMGLYGGRESFRPEVCIHLAWEGLPDYSEKMCQRNYDATMALYDLLDCRRFVGIGSCFEYGRRHGYVAESDEAPESMGLFTAYKTALRLYGQHWAKQLNREFVWIRPFYVYGHGQRKESLLPAAYAALKAGKEPRVNHPNTGQDFIYVDDVAEGIARLTTEKVASGVYNLGSGQSSYPRDMVNLVASLMTPPSELPKRRGPVSDGLLADMTKTKAATGWQPQVSLEEWIRRTVAEWEKQT